MDLHCYWYVVIKGGPLRHKDNFTLARTNNQACSWPKVQNQLHALSYQMHRSSCSAVRMLLRPFLRYVPMLSPKLCSHFPYTPGRKGRVWNRIEGKFVKGYGQWGQLNQLDVPRAMFLIFVFCFTGSTAIICLGISNHAPNRTWCKFIWFHFLSSRACPFPDAPCPELIVHLAVNFYRVREPVVECSLSKR